MLNDAGNFAACFSFVLYFSVSLFSHSHHRYARSLCASRKCSFGARPNTWTNTIYIRDWYSAIVISKHWIFDESSVVVQWIVNSLLAIFSIHAMCGRALMWMCIAGVHTQRSAKAFHVHVIIYILLGKSAMKWIALRKSSEKWNRILKRETIKQAHEEQFTTPIFTILLLVNSSLKRLNMRKGTRNCFAYRKVCVRRMRVCIASCCCCQSSLFKFSGNVRRICIFIVFAI